MKMFTALLTLSGSSVWKDRIKDRTDIVWVILGVFIKRACARVRNVISNAMQALSFSGGAMSDQILRSSCTVQM